MGRPVCARTCAHGVHLLYTWGRRMPGGLTRPGRGSRRRVQAPMWASPLVYVSARDPSRLAWLGVPQLQVGRLGPVWPLGAAGPPAPFLGDTLLSGTHPGHRDAQVCHGQSLGGRERLSARPWEQV